MAVRDWPRKERGIYYLYARWRLGRAEFKAYGPKNWKHRPRELPRYIPLRWRQEFDRMFAPKPPPPPPPVQHRSPFAGVGMLLAWDPLAALRLGGLIDWVAVQAEGHTHGVPWTTPEIVSQLKAAGSLVHVWEAAVREGGAAVSRLGANGGYIGQNENRVEHDRCMALPPMDCAKALVGNPGVLPEPSHSGEVTWPQDWYGLLEVYTNANPSAKAENVHFEAWKRGCRDMSLCYGLYDAAAEQPGVGTRIPLRAYRAHSVPKGLEPHGFCGYLGETLTDDDVAYLAELRRAA